MGRLNKCSGVAIIIVSIFASFAGVTHSQDCGKSKDWKDIYVLPTNPNPQNNIKVSISAERQFLKPGDELKLTFTADRECYLTLMDMGTSGKILRIWPNDYSGQDNWISPNISRSFPGPGDKFRYRISGPDGTERIIAFATSEKGKILSEREFQQFKNTGFKEYPGSAKDLAIHFHNRTEIVGPNVNWGTAQVNVCIASGSVHPGPEPGPPPPDVISKSSLYMISMASQTGKLKYCNDNARNMAKTFQTKMGLEPSNTKILINEDADYQGFVSGIKWLASLTRPEDKVIIYYSGHGGSCRDRPPKDEEDGRDEFLVLWPGQREGMTLNECFKKKICMVDDEINMLVKKIQARQKIFIVDSCHAGTMSKDLGSEDDMVSMYQPMVDPDTGQQDWGLAQKATPPNYGNDHEAILAACLDNETSWEIGKLKAGLFTFFLMEAIEKGSPNLDQAFRVARENVIKWTQEAHRRTGKPYSQTPCITDPHGLTKELKFQN